MTENGTLSPSLRGEHTKIYCSFLFQDIIFGTFNDGFSLEWCDTQITFEFYGLQFFILGGFIYFLVADYCGKFCGIGTWGSDLWKQEYMNNIRGYWMHKKELVAFF